VAHVALAGLTRAPQVDGELACSRRSVAAEQRAEDRVAVGPRQAHPHDARHAVHQRRDLAVADDGEFERRAHAAPSPGTATQPDSQSSTSATPPSPPRAPSWPPRPDAHRQPAVRVDGTEAILVRDVVADEDRDAAGERRLGHEVADRVRLARARRLDFQHALARTGA
jgi:hypothetical protein